MSAAVRPRIPTTDGARRTRDRVLSSALELFNERGSACVTTNHVAAHAGISPGNLYYWFGDKDEIVRELYGQFVAAYEQLWWADRGEALDLTPDGDPPDRGDALELTPDDVLARLAGGAALSRRYAFLARDLLGLLHADPQLAAEYRVVRERRLAEFTGLAHLWRAHAVIGPLDDGTVADLVEALWVVAETWLAFAEIDGATADAEHGTRLLRVVLAPYLTPSVPSSG